MFRDLSFGTLINMLVLSYSYLLVFTIGSLLGWIIELIYRNIFTKKNSNPGFLRGPYLPIYGFGMVFFYFLAEIEMPIVIRFLVYGGATAVLEFIAGEFFLGFFNIRLWDYSEEKFNLRGHICPKFTLLFSGLSIIFYFILYSHIKNFVTLAAKSYNIIWASGFFFGFFVNDIFVSFRLALRLKLYIRDAIARDRELLERLKKELIMGADRERQNIKRIISDLKSLDIRILRREIREKLQEKKISNPLHRFFNPFLQSSINDLENSVKEYFKGKKRDKL